jgi:hypothetical protein
MSPRLNIRRQIATILLTLPFLTAFWFLGVDRSWFFEECPDCSFDKEIFQYRVRTIPISERTQEYVTTVQRIAKDIGAECKHPNLKRWHKHRYWGLLICAYPCINGYRVVDSGNWYDARAQFIVMEMAKTNSSIRNEFAMRVLAKHDSAYLRRFCDRVRAARDAPLTQ